MKRVLVPLVACLTWLLIPACEPDQPEATVACTALHDCPFGQVCDLTSKVCIPEADNRIVGSLTCNIIMSGQDPVLKDQATEAAGRVAGLHYAFSDGQCVAFDLDDDPATPPLINILLYPANTNKRSLSVRFEQTALSSGSFTVVPHTDLGVNSVELTDSFSSRRLGTGVAGTVRLVKGTVAAGQQATLNFDITMQPATTADPRYGRPCPLGLAQCGQLLKEVGGASRCSTLEDETIEPICYRDCLSDSDCAVGSGICVGGICALSCLTEATCDPGRTCVNNGVRNGPKGCL